MEVISTYSTQEAIDDGVFVDLSGHELIKEHGFNWPVTVTSGVFEILRVEEGSALDSAGQSFDGRLHDLLTMAKMEVRRMVKEEDWFGSFKAMFAEVINSDARIATRTQSFFIAVNDLNGKPCFTIMKPEEY